MITVCAWNRPEDGPHIPSGLLADDGKDDGRLSHGICWGHAEHMREKLGLTARRPKKKEAVT